MTLGKDVLMHEDMLEGVPELLALVQIEAQFDYGTTHVPCHDPVPAEC